MVQWDTLPPSSISISWLQVKDDKLTVPFMISWMTLCGVCVCVCSYRTWVRGKILCGSAVECSVVGMGCSCGCGRVVGVSDVLTVLQTCMVDCASLSKQLHLCIFSLFFTCMIAKVLHHCAIHKIFPKETNCTPIIYDCEHQEKHIESHQTARKHMLVSRQNRWGVTHDSPAYYQIKSGLFLDS